MSDKRNCWIGVDLGGTKMLAVVFDQKFEAVGRARKKTKGREGVEVGLERINELIADAIQSAGITPEQVIGLGIGCPGPLDLEKREIRAAPNLGWKDVPIARSIETRFGFPVAIANDVDAGVFGEYKFGAGKNMRCVVGIFPGTGIGGGCVYEGHLIRGANSSCMEIGHIPLVPFGPLDGAGNPGSLEGMASRLSIAGHAAQAVYRGQAPNLAAIAGTDISNIRSGQIAEAIKKGDKAILEIVENTNRYLALSVVTMVHLMAPDVIVFGGGLIEELHPYMLEPIEKMARKRVLPSMRDVFKIAKAKLGDDAGVRGAAALAQQAVEEGKILPVQKDSKEPKKSEKKEATAS
jgi:glucokinase